MSLRKKLLSSISWLALLRYSSRLIDVLKIALLTRVLTPTDFGNFALATVTINTLEALSDTGFSFAFIHLQGNINTFAKTLWIATILRGILIGILAFTLAFILPQLFHTNGLMQLLILASLIPVINGFQSPYVVSFQKELAFKKEFFFRIIPYAITSLASLSFAYLLKNPVGLLLGMIAGALSQVLFSFIVTRASFSHPFDKRKAIKLFHYGKFLTGSSIFTFLMTEIDTLFVGRVFGPSLLGVYDLTFKLANIVFSEFTDIISRVTFPFYSRIQKNFHLMRRVLTVNVIVVAVPASIVSFLFFLFPAEILTYAFGEKWRVGAGLLQVLSIYGFFRAISGPIAPVYLAKGKPKIIAITNVLNFVIIMLLIIPLSKGYGILGVAYAMTAAYITSQVYSYYQFFSYMKIESKKNR